MGFEVERFLGEVDSSLLCAFCNGVVEEPVAGKCGHLFCRACLEKALSKRREECPVCELDISSVVEAKAPSEELVEKLGELSLQCKHHKDGCEAVVGYHALPAHMMRECKFRLVACEHKGCSEVVSHADLEAHMEQCNHRLVECKVCKTCLPRKDMSAHQAIKRCFEELNKRRMVRSARRLSSELREHRVELIHQRHATEQAERALVRKHYFPEGSSRQRTRAMSAGPILMRSSVQARVGSAVVIPHYSRMLKSATIESCHDCTNKFTHGRRPSAHRHSHVNVSTPLVYIVGQGYFHDTYTCILLRLSVIGGGGGCLAQPNPKEEPSVLPPSKLKGW